jgi:hypothetical protein
MPLDASSAQESLARSVPLGDSYASAPDQEGAIGRANFDGTDVNDNFVAGDGGTPVERPPLPTDTLSEGQG